jgi:chemotaxis protein MotB
MTRPPRPLIALAACLTLAACGVPRDLHDSVAQDLEDTLIELSEQQRVVALQRAQLEGAAAELEAAKTREDEAAERADALAKELERARGKLDSTSDKADELGAELAATRAELEQLRRAREAAERRAAQYRAITERLAEMTRAGTLAVVYRDGKMVIQLSNAILFDVGSSKLRGPGRAALAEVADALKSVQRDFLVAGHTDDVPIKTKKYPDNWVLSSARAIEVVRFLKREGVDPGRLAAAGFGPYDPVAPNTTEEGRARNRRIEVILLPDVSELPPMPDASSTPEAAPVDDGARP